MPFARLTVTLPQELVDGIDRHERNRSRFVAEAVANELQRRRSEGLRKSLASPHPEVLVVAEEGIAEWGDRGGAPRRSGTAGGDDGGLVDPARGRPVAWARGKGWTRGGK